jgi:hypothetical protein
VANRVHEDVGINAERSVIVQLDCRLLLEAIKLVGAGIEIFNCLKKLNFASTVRGNDTSDVSSTVIPDLSTVITWTSRLRSQLRLVLVL